MSLSPDELNDHCQMILNDARIAKKIIILCEGKIKPFIETKSVQLYRKMKDVPDANFYFGCIPTWWNREKPRFFTCGDRKDVIDTYFKLLELHDRDQNQTDIEKRKSRLNPNYLFALVDLDIPVQKIGNPDYSFSDTEEIYYDLYQNAKVNQANAKKHRIWVTGLIYKEAYFLLPEFQSFFTENERIPAPIYKDKTLVLDELYLDAANTIGNDGGIKQFFSRVCDRIKFCSGLDFTERKTLQESWITEFKKTKDKNRKRELVLALLTIKKVKTYWKKIKPPHDCTHPEKRYREQILLELVQSFYAKQGTDSEYHILVFFKTLYDRVYNKT